MTALPHQADHCRELVELRSFRRSQWVSFEERNDAPLEVDERPHGPSPHVMSMVVMPAVDTDVTAPEVLLQVLQNMRAWRCLDDDELRLNLPTEARTSLPKDRHREAAFSVNEPDDPLLEAWPFLLIVRTGHIVTSTADTTVSRRTDSFGSTGYSGFPAYSQLQLRNHFRSGQIREWRFPGFPTLGWL